ncbi:MAG: hypothetical protein QOJ07_675 [Thermoleophilaceae bacterium]|nr:hypothetical protein [Thermoleophilaceae bacterium]
MTPHDQPGDPSVWRVRAGRIGLGATLLSSAALFASALGGIASIDVNAESARPQVPHVVTPHHTRDIGLGRSARDCPNHRTDTEHS